MEKIKRLLLIFASILFLGFFITTVFKFFDIGIQTYGIYLLFMISLLLLYAFLPQQTGSIFNN
jgi:hypothetical protein